ncbi:MAG: adenylyltransferase, partial [Thiotrichales bacterium]|nr:adenylyltransferase [Thiotrichales bacterium]
MPAQTNRTSLKPLLVGEAEAQTLKSESLDMPSLTLSQRQLCDLELLMNGGFTPLDGFMDRETYTPVLDSMRLPDGQLWPIPVVLDITRERAEKLEVGSRVALRDQEGLALAILDISGMWEADKHAEAQQVYGTTSARHPGVRHLHERIGEIYVGGRVSGIRLPTHYDHQGLRHTPRELGRFFDRLGWRRVIAFHTSRPMHRRERELTLDAAREVRGHLLLHPVAGVTMHHDLAHFARIKCYQEILRHYPQQLAALSLLPLAT